ncbi:TadE family protein [Pigmentiphaga soli]
MARDPGSRAGRKAVRGGQTQHGTYALEFALAFPVFFIIFYGALTIGLIAIAQHLLKLAAEDGARATLRYFVAAPSGAQGAPQVLQLKGRLAHGCAIADDRAKWLNEVIVSAVPNCEAYLTKPCSPAEGGCRVDLDAAPADTPVCTDASGCEAKVVVSYSYRSNPLIPVVPLVSMLVPDVIEGSASVLLDPEMLQ